MLEHLCTIAFCSHVIRAINMTQNVVWTLVGSQAFVGSVDGVGTSAKFNGPSGLAVSSNGAFLFVVDMYSHNIRKVEIATRMVTTIAGSVSGAFGWADDLGTSALFSYPSAVALVASGVSLCTLLLLCQ